MPIFDYKSKLPSGLNQGNIDEELARLVRRLHMPDRIAAEKAASRSTSELQEMASRTSGDLGKFLAVAGERGRFEDVKEEVRLRMQKDSSTGRRKAQSILASPDAFGSSASATLSKRFQLG